MALAGRGRCYSPVRGVIESVLGRAFVGGWPARLPAWMAVRRIDLTLPTPELGAGARLKVGFASDLHAGPTTSPSTLAQAFAHLSAFDPDVLLLGGDYVLFEARHAEQLAPLIRRVRAPLGRYAVLGNHDLWADDRLIIRTLERAGVELLVNRTVRLPGLPATMGGLDDAWTGRPHYQAAFAGREAVHLLLMHSPDHVPHMPRDLRFTLALCGHTHGGQVCLPSGIPLLMPSTLSRSFAHGRFELPGGLLMVSRGVGNVELPFRAFAAPDVLCVTLTGEPPAVLR
ncbi:MAG: metallophosphoesterase family protein [Deltaproteobacteria bacterium]|nr:metallophosphoesterase family protein [Deltaproteobacteria bacterium]